MVSKNEFIKYCERVEKTEKGILRLEEAFGGIVLREMDFCSLSNYADTVAAMFLGVPDGWMESFVTDFWNVIDNGESEVDITFPTGDEEHFIIKGFDGLYDWWKKEIEENDA